MTQSPPFAAPAPPAAAARPAGFSSTDALLALMVLVWGTNYIVLKAALAVVEPLAFNAVRFALAAVCLAAIAWVRGAPRPPAGMIPRLAALGLLGNTIYQLCFIEGIAHTRAGNAALIMAAVPVQTAVISHFRGHERLRGRDAGGLALSIAGIAAIIFGSGKAVGFGGTVVGDVLMLLATACWSFYTIGTKPVADELGITTATTWTMGLGAVPLVLICTPSVLAQNWRAVTPAAWAALVFSSIGALVVAYLIWYRGVQRLGPSRTAFYSNVTPVVAMLTAWVALGETPTPWQLAGAGGIFGGLYLTRT